MKTASITNACNVSHASKSTSFIQEVAWEFLKSMVVLILLNLHVHISQFTVSIYQALEHNKEVALSTGKFFWLGIYLSLQCNCGAPCI